MNKYFLHGKLTAKPGEGDNLTQILLQAAQKVKSAKGCRLYIINRDSDHADDIWVTEVWDSKEDHDNSLNDAETKQLILRAIPLLDGTPQKGQELEYIGGFGI